MAISLNKTGPHLRGPIGPNAGAWGRSARIVKQLDGTDVLRANSGAITIFRKWFANQDLGRGGAAVAADVINACGGFVPTYIEAYNETAQNLGGGLEQYVTFMQEFSDYAHGRGYRVAGFSFSEANPTNQAWLYVAGRGFGGVDALSIHEYWGLTLFTEDHALRHRYVHRLLVSSGYPNHPPFVITEAGRDYINDGQTQQYCQSQGCNPNCGTEGGCGWMKQGVSADQFAREIASYDALISQDSYVIGAVIFTSGGAPDFTYFEIEQPAAIIVGGPSTCAAGCHWDGQQCVNDTDGLPCGQPPTCPPGCHWDALVSACVDDATGMLCGGGPGPGPGLTPMKVLVATGLAAGAILALTYALGEREEEGWESPPEEYEAYPMRRV